MPLPPSPPTPPRLVSSPCVATWVFVECPAHVTQDWASKSPCQSAAWAPLCEGLRPPGWTWGAVGREAGVGAGQLPEGRQVRPSGGSKVGGRRKSIFFCFSKLHLCRVTPALLPLCLSLSPSSLPAPRLLPAGGAHPPPRGFSPSSLEPMNRDSAACLTGASETGRSSVLRAGVGRGRPYGSLRAWRGLAPLPKCPQLQGTERGPHLPTSQRLWVQGLSLGSGPSGPGPALRCTRTSPKRHHVPTDTRPASLWSTHAHGLDVGTQQAGDPSGSKSASGETEARHGSRAAASYSKRSFMDLRFQRATGWLPHRQMGLGPLNPPFATPAGYSFTVTITTSSL